VPAVLRSGAFSGIDMERKEVARSTAMDITAIDGG